MNITRRSAPSQRSIVFFVNEKNHISSALRNTIARSYVVISCGASGVITLVRPSMMRMFRMHEPITLPSAMDVLPFKAATRLVASSGIQVPKPRIVIPITASDTPRSVASSVA